MVEWANALQISMIGGAFVFAYIASTISVNETGKFNNGIKMLFYLFSLGMLVASTGMNYPIINSQDPALLNETNVAPALRGVFISQIWIVAGLFLLLLIFALLGIVMHFRMKKRKRQIGDIDYD